MTEQFNSRELSKDMDAYENRYPNTLDDIRDMMRRVEIAWPITDEKNRARILQECCQMYLDDNKDSWLLNPDGTYTSSAELLLASTEQVNKPVLSFSAQQKLIEKYSS